MAASSRSRGTPSVARWPKKNGSARRLGGIRFLTGLLSFFAICSVGVIANVGIAAAVFQQHYAWWLSALAGIAVGFVWNYAVSSVFTWRRAC
jgi:dolichol-phosphate mannosyltransferase